MATLRFTKLSPTHHRFECRRDDGTRESVDLESRSFLLHDFIHYAVETEAGLRRSFYGLLVAGESYMSLSTLQDMASGALPMDEAATTESVVGPLTNLAKGQQTPQQFMEMMSTAAVGLQRELPAWLTLAWVVRAEARLRRLLGQWKGTPFGQTMELPFPAQG